MVYAVSFIFCEFISAYQVVFLDTLFVIHSLEDTCSQIDLCFLQSGHNIAQVREKMRELIKQIILTYSAAKTFPYIQEGLRSRNNRTRIECVDLVGFLLENHVSEVKSLYILSFCSFGFALTNA